MESPPNLRLSQGEQHCGACAYAAQSGTICTIYNNYPVEPNLVCDHFAPASTNKPQTPQI